ncbi:MAG TPA: hypothetical protein VKN18_01815 [Blastocatellia bacterium]|nr:hypothetical protein [Blastocatellia bacterium]
MRKKILLICGSLNQTTQMHQIAEELSDCDLFFTPFYGDLLLSLARRFNLAEFTVMGTKFSSRCLEYLNQHQLALDLEGRSRDYDLILTCSDLVVPKNILKRKIVLVQEGMTDPENLAYHIVRRVPMLPRWLASTAATGLSNAFTVFCVASEGYRELFIKKGVRSEKIVVTGIPNFDNCARFLKNDFPFRGFVLVCTSDTRETFKFDNRKRFIERAVSIAAGRQLIFKLHPNENVDRSTSEIRAIAPRALVYSKGSAEEMIANCDVLITQYSSTAFVGIALGKEVHSYFNADDLRKLMPIQNNCAAKNIAAVCRGVLETAQAYQCRKSKYEDGSIGQTVSGSYAYENACCSSGQNKI